MPPIKQKVEVFREEYVCDECGAGVMVFDTMQKPSGNDKFRHECSYCVVKTHLTLKYPIITYEPVASSTAQAEQPESVQFAIDGCNCPDCTVGTLKVLSTSRKDNCLSYIYYCANCNTEFCFASLFCFKAEQTESVQTDGELKRCPFCGGQALLLSSHDFGNIWYQGQCVKCFAEAEQSGLISEAISNWNRRDAVLWLDETVSLSDEEFERLVFSTTSFRSNSSRYDLESHIIGIMDIKKIAEKAIKFDRERRK